MTARPSQQSAADLGIEAGRSQLDALAELVMAAAEAKGQRSADGRTE